jgi:hypothetical protein
MEPELREFRILLNQTVLAPMPTLQDNLTRTPFDPEDCISTELGRQAGQRPSRRVEYADSALPVHDKGDVAFRSSSREGHVEHLLGLHQKPVHTTLIGRGRRGFLSFSANSEGQPGQNLPDVVPGFWYVGNSIDVIDSGRSGVVGTQRARQVPTITN